MLVVIYNYTDDVQTQERQESIFIRKERQESIFIRKERQESIFIRNEISFFKYLMQFKLPKLLNLFIVFLVI